MSTVSTNAMRRPARALPSLALLVLSLALLGGCATTPRTHGAGSVAERRILPLADCLDPDRARGWALVDSDELLVDAGRHRYRIVLARACPEVATASAIVFRGSSGLGRVCGNAMDAVLVASSRNQMQQPCPIASIELLDESMYQQYLDQGELTVSPLDERPPRD
jgi:hypothetical protein